MSIFATDALGNLVRLGAVFKQSTDTPANPYVSGYGLKIPTQYLADINGKWQRVYCACFSNSGSLWVQIKGERVLVDEVPGFAGEFDSYVCKGDRIECQVDGVDYVAYLEHDNDRRPDDDECYTAAQIQAWRSDEWAYFGVVIAASVDGVLIDDNLASLWGVEGNFPVKRQRRNSYLREVANELLPEAIEAATKLRREMAAKLAKGL